MESNNQLFGQLDYSFLISPIASGISLKEEWEFEDTVARLMSWHSLWCFLTHGLEVFVSKKEEQ